MSLGFQPRGSEIVDYKPTLPLVIPAQAGIQVALQKRAKMDAGLRRHDKSSLSPNPAALAKFWQILSAPARPPRFAVLLLALVTKNPMLGGGALAAPTISSQRPLARINSAPTRIKAVQFSWFPPVVSVAS